MNTNESKAKWRENTKPRERESYIQDIRHSALSKSQLVLPRFGRFTFFCFAFVFFVLVAFVTRTNRESPGLPPFKKTFEYLFLAVVGDIPKVLQISSPISQEKNLV